MLVALGTILTNALVTADIHWTDNSRDAYRFQFVDTLHDIIKKKDVSLLIIAGDLTENKDSHGAWLVNTIVDIIYQLSQKCQIVILTGNHDWADPDNPFFEFLLYIENVTWINKPIKKSTYPEVGPSLFLPFTYDYKKDWTGLPFDKVRWIFAHQTFQGANVGFGHTMDKGIPLNVFPDNAQVISGDIHVPQRLGCVTYVGAPYSIDFGDDYKPRVLLLSGSKKTSIPIPGPQKRLIELASIDDLKRPLKTQVNPGDLVKVRVCINMANAARWHEYQDRVRAWGVNNDYQIHVVQPVVVDHRVDASVQNKIRDVKSDRMVLESYGKQRGIDDRTLGIGLELLEG